MNVKTIPATDPPPDVEITLSHEEALRLARVLFGPVTQSALWFEELWENLPDDIRDLAASSSAEAIESARLD